MYRSLPQFSRFPRALASMVVALALFVLPARAEWIQLNGPEPPDVTTIAEGAGVLYVGTGISDAGDTFRSTDGGATWQNAHLPNGGTSTAFTHNGNAYLGAYLTGLYRSTDDGVTWQQVIVGNSIRAITGTGTTLFAGSDDFSGRRIQRSLDDGQTWSELASSPSVQVHAMEAFSGNIFAGTIDEGLYRSTDNGETWALANNGFPAGARIEALAVDGARVLAGVTVNAQPTELGLYESIDQGASWNRLDVDLPTNTALRFVSLAIQPGKIYAGLVGNFGGAGIYLSTDGGVHWDAISGSLPNGNAQTLLAQAGGLFVGTPEGVFHTSNDGGDWTYAGQGTAAIRGVSAMLQTTNGLFVGLTTNSGLTRGFWRTTDLGESWIGDPQNPGAVCQTFLERDGVLLTGFYGAMRGVYRSTDEGTSWIESNAGISMATIIYDIFETDGIFLTGAYENLYRSTDGGWSWDTVPGMTEVKSIVSFDGDLVAGRYGQGVFRSTDLGATWSSMNNGLPGSAWHINQLLAFDGTLFAATNATGIYRWNGAAWELAGLTNTFPEKLLGVGGVLIAGTALQENLYASVDHGENWTPIADGYSGGEIYALETDGTYLFAGSRGHAVWARPLAEIPGTVDVPPASDIADARLLWSQPNPFRSETTLRFFVPRDGAVRMELLDVTGRRVRLLAEGEMDAGMHQIEVTGGSLPPGVYYSKLSFAGSDGDVRRIVVLR